MVDSHQLPVVVHCVVILLILSNFSFFSHPQDFVIYLLAASNVTFGRQSDAEAAPKPDFLLFAADVLPSHCCFLRPSAGVTVLRPGPDALVTRNGQELRAEVKLHPGDVVGLGQRYLFLFKDPVVPKVLHSSQKS